MPSSVQLKIRYHRFIAGMMPALLVAVNIWTAVPARAAPLIQETAEQEIAGKPSVVSASSNAPGVITRYVARNGFFTALPDTMNGRTTTHFSTELEQAEIAREKAAQMEAIGIVVTLIFGVTALAAVPVMLFGSLTGGAVMLVIGLVGIIIGTIVWIVGSSARLAATIHIRSLERQEYDSSSDGQFNRQWQTQTTPILNVKF